MSKNKIKNILIIMLLLAASVAIASAKPDISNNSLEIDGGGNQHIKVLSNDMSKGNAFEFFYRDTRVSFVPKSIYLQSSPHNDIKAVSVQSQNINNIFKMDEMFGVNTSYSLTQESGFVKEELILLSNLYPLAQNDDMFVFKHRFNYSGLIPYINGFVWDETSISTSEKILFKDGNEIIFSFTKPYAFDSNNNEIILSYDISKNKQTGEMNIKLNVPMSFLNTAKYPVTIDPSLEQSGGSITLDGDYTYDYVNLTNGAVLYVSAYNATGTTGLLNLSVTYDLNVDSTSSINAIGRGYTGGAGGIYASGNGKGGVPDGVNGAGVACAVLIGGGGGGGGHAFTGGTGGAGNYGGSGGAGGAARGTVNGSDINLGGGGGGGGLGSGFGCTQDYNGAAGGAGGGVINITAKNMYVYGTITTNGSAGGAGGGNYWFGGGGGGAAGGTIKITSSNNINLSGALLSAAGGAGGNSGNNACSSEGSGGCPGQTGSGGRIKIFYANSFTNASGINTGSLYVENTNTAPTIPQILYPSNASRHYNNSINFTWNVSTDADNDTITYDFWLSNQSDFSSSVNRTTFIDNWTGAISIPNDVIYYSKVRAYDGLGYSDWSNVVQFDEYPNFLFSNKANSESQIYQSSQATLISVDVIDLGGNNITSVYVGITLWSETNYTMTQSGTLWSYSFSTGSIGTHTITNFYATDNLGGTNNSVWTEQFTVVPVIAGGGSSSGGGGGGGGGSVVPVTSIPPEMPKVLPSVINVGDIASDPLGVMIIQASFILGLLLVLGNMLNGGKVGSLIFGFAIMGVSAFALGWLA